MLTIKTRIWILCVSSMKRRHSFHNVHMYYSFNGLWLRWCWRWIQNSFQGNHSESIKLLHSFPMSVHVTASGSQTICVYWSVKNWVWDRFTERTWLKYTFVAQYLFCVEYPAVYTQEIWCHRIHSKFNHGFWVTLHMSLIVLKAVLFYILGSFLVHFKWLETFSACILCVYSRCCWAGLCAWTEHTNSLSRHVLACMLACVPVFT